MNKCLNVIGILLVLLLFPYCGRQDARQIEGHGSIAHAALAEIDSLMWRRADSAFVLLQEFVVGPEAEELDTFDGHYCQVLISVLLYKNDCEQTNREDLLKAVDFFDSLIVNKHDANKREVVTQKQNVFLDARAHYINGVGYYEQGNVVQACAEYLKALELMEEHFEEKELVREKAQFMAYIGNRLGDMFSEQFMMESSIVCYEKALVYCKIQSTSPQGVSNILTRLGMQYDKLGDKEKMRDCYGQALEAIPSSDNLSYRDLAASKALCDYQLGLGIDHSLAVLRQILVDADDEEERKTRFLTIGAMFAEEGIYDSAMYYLEPLFENEDDIALKIPAAECLRTIYDSIGDNEKLDRCLRFMALQKKSEAQNKALVSQLEDMFKSYTNQKLKNEAERVRKKSIRKTIKVIVPIAIVVALVIFIVSKKRNEKLLKKQQEEADKVLGETEQQHEEELRQRQAEAEKILEDKERSYQREMESERLTHKMQQAALSGRLKRSNEELRDVSSQLEQMLEKNVSSGAVHSDDYKAFVNTSICLHIVGLVHTQQYKSKMDYLIYKDNALSKEQLLALRDAAETNLPRFVTLIRKQFPKLTDNDMDYCYLFLLGLNEADISALMQRAYTTVCDRSRKINRIIGANESLYHTLRNMLSE